MAEAKYTTYYLDTFNSEAVDFIPVTVRNTAGTRNEASHVRVKIPNDVSGAYAYNAVAIQRLSIAGSIYDVDQRHWKSADEPFHFTINENPRKGELKSWSISPGDRVFENAGVAIPPFRFVEEHSYLQALADQAQSQFTFGPDFVQDGGGAAAQFQWSNVAWSQHVPYKAALDLVAPTVGAGEHKIRANSESTYPLPFDTLTEPNVVPDTRWTLGEIYVSMKDPVWRRRAVPFANACDMIVRGMIEGPTFEVSGQTLVPPFVTQTQTQNCFHALNSLFSPSMNEIFIGQDKEALPQMLARGNARKMPAQVGSRRFRYNFYIDPLTRRFTIEVENNNQTTAEFYDEAIQDGFDPLLSEWTTAEVDFTFHNRLLAGMLGLDVGTDQSATSFTVRTVPYSVPGPAEGKQRIIHAALPELPVNDGADHKTDLAPFWWRGKFVAPNPVNPSLGRLLYLHLTGSNLAFRAGLERFDDSIHQIYYAPGGSNEDVQPYNWENTQSLAFYPLPLTNHVELTLKDSLGNTVPMNGGHVRAQLVLRKGPRVGS